MTQPTITVLVPAHNEAETIVECVQAIQASRGVHLEQVIVVADACDDLTSALAYEAGATVYETDAKDKAGAQNAVLPMITTELVVGFDGDTFPDPECIATMLAAMADNDAVCSTVLPVQRRGFFIRARRFAYALGRRWWRTAQSSIGRVQVLTGASYCFRTDAIKAIGGFPTVGISADMDATWGLHKAGYRLAYVGAAVAYTVDPETFYDYRQQMQRWASGYFQTMAKHRGQLGHWRALLVVGTGLFDLVTLPLGYALVVYGLVTDQPWVRWYWAWFLGHAAVNTVVVATVVGWREAVLGVVPYTIVNLYNKALYIWTGFREWVLGRHWAAWTGRAGRKAQVTAMTPARKVVLAVLGALLSITLARFGISPFPLL